MEENKEVELPELKNKLKKIDSIKIVIPEDMKKQDFSQRVNVFSSILLELYRVITSSLLIIFVPQDCAGTLCTTTQNLTWTDPFYNTTLIFNFITLVSFLPLYYIEVKRENRLIKYLDISPDMPNDNERVEETLKQLPLVKKQKIIQIDKQYQRCAYAVIFIYSINVIFSGITISNYYLGQQTVSVFITYVLFILTKLINVYTIANTNENIFYSAYLKVNAQYNDVDTSYDQLTSNEKVKSIMI
jgi:hypothetical protein